MLCSEYELKVLCRTGGMSKGTATSLLGPHVASIVPMPLSPLSSATLLNTFSGQYVGIGADCSGEFLLMARAEMNCLFNLITPARTEPVAGDASSQR